MEIEQIIETAFAAEVYSAAVAMRAGREDVRERVEHALCMVWERMDGIVPVPTTSAVHAIAAKYVTWDDDDVPWPLPVEAWGNVVALRAAGR